MSLIKLLSSETCRFSGLLADCYRYCATRVVLLESMIRLISAKGAQSNGRITTGSIEPRKRTGSDSMSILASPNQDHTSVAGK